MLRNRFLLGLILSLFTIENIFSINSTYIFTHYTTQDGLCNDYIHDISQDHNGFLWIATHYGINRFDGQEFKSFFLDEYSSMMRNDFYHAFCTVNSMPLFASSYGTIIGYDKEKDLFIDYSQKLGKKNFLGNITGFFSDKEPDYYVSSSEGIFKHNNHTDDFTKLNIKLTDNATLDFFIDEYLHQWISTPTGVYVLNEKSDIIKGYVSLSTVQDINNIIAINKHQILLASSTNKSYLVELNSDGSLQSLIKLDLPFLHISEVIISREGQLWVGTAGNGLWKSKAEYPFSFEKIEPQNKDEELTKKISALFEDKNGNIWFGTQNSGLWCCQSTDQISFFHSNNIGVPNICCSAFDECQNGDILIGTDGQGLWTLDSTYKIKHHYKDKDGLSSNNLLSFTHYLDDIIISFWGGVPVSYNPQKQSFKAFPFVGIQRPSLTLKDIKANSDGEMIACTSGDGAYYYSPNDKWKKLPLSLNNEEDRWMISSLVKKDSFLILSSRAIWCKHKETISRITPDRDNESTHNPHITYQCATDSKGIIWVATNNGIYKIQGNNYQAIHFLPQGVYKSILTDKEGNIWACGSVGLIQFSPNDSTYKLLLPISKDKDLFVEKAIYEKSNGDILLGCKNGFILYKNKKSETTKEYIQWGDLFIHNKKIEVGSDILKEPLLSGNPISIPYSKSNIDLTFEMVNYSQIETHNSYRIIGWDSTWTPLQHRTISINHLPIGKYLIELGTKTGNEDEIALLSLPLNITPSWWQTTWFKLLIGLLVLTIGGTLYKLRINRIKRQKRELEQIVLERTQELDHKNILLENQKEEIKEQNTALLNSLKEKNQLISIVAHDLKNPMFAIVSALEDVLNKEKKSTNTPIILQSIYQSASSLQNEMIKLLDWVTEGNKDKNSCNIQDLNIKQLTEEVISLLHGMAEEKNIEIKLFSSIKHFTKADSKMVSTILRNIITNAIKFTPKGKDVTIQLSEDPDTTNIFIQDSGVGMTQQQIKDLLNGSLSHSSLGTEKEKGYGLGFKIISDFIEKNNGKLDIQSEVGNGTTMRIELPISSKEIEVSPMNIVTSDVIPQINKSLLEGKSILAIDDDPLILLHINKILTPYVNVFCANNANEGITIAQKEIPDLIISDIEMPETNGIEMYEKLKQNNHTSNIPLLFLSALNSTDIRIAGLGSGAIDYITKPFNEQELLMKICNILICLKNQQVQALIHSYNNETSKENLNPLLDELLDIVKQNYTNTNFSFDDIANALNMSKSTLTRRLKTLTDKSPVEILAEYRLNKAKELLKGDFSSVSEVAYQVGFNDPIYFSKKFKEAFGVLPSKAKNNDF